MIPFAAEIGIRNRRQRDLQLWIPLALVWLLLFPFAVVLLPFFLIACRLGDVSPLNAIAVLWGVLTSLAGTELRVEQPGSSLYIHLY